MSAVHAMENAAGIAIGGQIRALRRLLYCGEWIESHVLHIYMLHAPDFLGLPDSIALARTHGDVVRAGPALKKIGNALIEVLGGRAIHPINVRVGGFWRAPSRTDLRAMVPDLEWAREAALATLRWVATLSAPDFEHDYEFVALRHPDEYPLNEGRIVSSAGIDVPPSGWPDVFEEFQVRHSTALHARVKQRGAYLTGPLARYSLNFDRLPADSKKRQPKRASARSAAIRSRASWCAPSKCCSPATRRCGSSRPTRSPIRPSSRWNRARRPATPPPRRRAACCISATTSTPRA